MRATQRLIARGFEAYLVGGCVRDLLLGRTPKDYDLATEARPPQIKRTFPRNCRIIGRRFKLAHLHFDNNTKILEMSTFRRTPQGDSDDADLLITRDNEFGTAEEDAMRRDFTVNALFLDPTRDCILDYCNGLEDLHKRVIRTIGDPVVRFREDPVRILRAVKFAGRLGFSIEPATFAAMAETAGDLARAAPPRVLEEILRLLRGGHALDSFQLLRDVGALRTLVPVVAEFLATASHEHRVAFWRLLEALDHQVQEGHVPGNAVLLAVLFVEPVLAAAENNPGRSPSSIAEQLLGSLGQDLRLPRRDAGCLKRICGVQHRFTVPEGSKRFRTAGFIAGPYFDEAFELFALRAVANGDEDGVVERWRALADGTPHVRLTEEGDAEGDHEHEDTDAAIALDAEDAAVETGEDEDGERPRRKRRRRRGRGRGRERAEEQSEPDEHEPSAAADDDTEPADDGHEAPIVADDEDAGIAEEANDERDAAGEPSADADEGGRKRRRRRRRRRGGRRDDDTFPRSEEPAPHGDAVDPDTQHLHEARAHGHDDEAEAFPADAGLEDVGLEDADELGPEEHDTEEHDTGDAVADGDEAGTAPAGDRKRRRRRRRGRRDRGDRGEGDEAQRGDGRQQQQGQQQQGSARRGEQQPAAQKSGEQRQGDQRQGGRKSREERRGRRDKRRGDRGHGSPRDVDVVPRYRDRRGKVEVLEPEPLDLSAFDVELDPKRVPTFGSIVEGKGRPKRRSPRVPEDGNDKYRPPPPPGSSSGPGAPPPPPPTDDDSDTFGDW
ncbi:MAG: polynucleotide adenylyltransferase PcnB [Planctomycetes bacterium]|nr:polynucleotide adenylyltransferase PcnB [Planctomycetota bacterium]